MGSILLQPFYFPEHTGIPIFSPDENTPSSHENYDNPNHLEGKRRLFSFSTVTEVSCKERKIRHFGLSHEIHFVHNLFSLGIDVFQIDEIHCQITTLLMTGHALLSKTLISFRLTCQHGLMVQFWPHKPEVGGLNPSSGDGFFLFLKITCVNWQLAINSN